MDAATKDLVRRRAENRCEYCRLAQEHAPFPTFHIEHIRARKHGGETRESNLCLACSFCNLHKSSNLTGIDSDTDEITRLFNPRFDNWEEHFQFNGPNIGGITPIGRTTASVLNMNDDERLELRAELDEQGLI
jgi:hypothetical protein